MKIYRIIWNLRFVDKISDKHGVDQDEVEEILFFRPHIIFERKGRVRGEDLYMAYGQTDEGRYLVVLFILKEGAAALPISARDMTRTERRYYEEHAKNR